MEVTVLATDAGLARRPGAGRWRRAARAGALRAASASSGRACARGALDAHVERADVVHLCNHWTVLNLMVQRAARRQAKPWAVCPAGALPIFGRSKALKRAYNALGGAQPGGAARQRGSPSPSARREDFRPYGVDPHRVDVIPNGIEPRDYRRRLTRRRFAASTAWAMRGCSSSWGG